MYLVNISELNAVYVYEVWSDEEAHPASLTLEAAQTFIKRTKPIITGMNKNFTLKTAGRKKAGLMVKIPLNQLFSSF
ncbi:hypothetical protein BIV59_19610 [Bacillus sp. MUM 13]|nr:hypothetical protein BIV59_19610 [Bacillus sp. MUM 13]